MIKSKYVEVEVEVNLEEFDDDELVAELKCRGYNTDSIQLSNYEIAINNIYEKYKLNQQYDVELRDLFYNVLGRIP